MTKPTHLDLERPVDLRRVLAWFETWTLPGAADKLVARVAAGEPMTPADWRVDVWGPLGVDESPAHAPLHDLLLQAPLLARPAVAVALAVRTWRLATADEGIPIQAARIARAALLWEAEDGDDLALEALADRDKVHRLASAWMGHARTFLESDDLAPVRAPVPPFLGPGTASIEPWHFHVHFAAEQQVLRSQFRDHLPTDLPPLEPLEPWLDARDREIPARTVDGVPWLSARLADYLRAKLGTDGEELAADWLTNERNREAKRTADEPQIPGLPPQPALAGWLAAVDVSGLGPGWGVSPAALALARAVWWAEVRPGLERSRKLLPSLPFKLHKAIVGASGGRVVVLPDGAELVGSGIRWAPDPRTGKGLPADVLARWLRSRLGYGLAGWRVLDLVMHELQTWIASEPTTAGSVPVTPRLSIPRGKALAERLGMPTSGKNGGQADDAVQVWGTMVVDLGDVRGRVWTVEEVKQAPGRSGAWIVTPGEVLIPGYVRALEDGVLVPWPDHLPDCEWIGPTKRADALEAALALPMLWRVAAGRGHGAHWQNQPGVRLAEHWPEHGRGLPMDRALEALEAQHWISRSGDLVAPGPSLPNLARFLDESAAKVRDKARKAARRPRNR